MKRALCLVTAFFISTTGIAQAGRLFWVDGSAPGVHYLNLGDLSVTLKHDDQVGQAYSAVFSEGQLWWWDHTRDVHRIFDPATFSIEIWNTPEEYIPAGPIVPVAALGKVYWVAKTTSNPSMWHIVRANSDGTAPELLVSVPYMIGDLELDVTRNAMYWIQPGMTMTIWRADLVGGNSQAIQTSLSLYVASRMEVDQSTGKIYWTSHSGANHPLPSAFVMRMNDDGSGIETIVADRRNKYELWIENQNSELFWQEYGRLYRANLDGSSATQFVNVSDRAGGLDEASGNFYFLQSDRVLKVTAAGAATYVFSSNAIKPAAILFDSNSSRMFWTDVNYLDFGTAYFVDLDADSPDMVLSHLTMEEDSKSIALHNASQMIYWSEDDYVGGEYYDCYIRRTANTGFGSVEVIHAELQEGDGPCRIQVATDSTLNDLYWAHGKDKQIFRSGLDGTSTQLLIDTSPYTPKALTLDVPGGYYYWAGSDTNGGGVIGRAALGSNVPETVLQVAPAVGRPHGLAVDGNTGHIYFSTNTGSIQRCDGDGSNMIELFAPGTANPLGLALVPPAVVPTLAAAPHDIQKNRYVSFVPDNAGAAVAFQVTLASNGMQPGAVGEVGWVGVPNASGLAGIVGQPVYRDWTESVVHVGGCGIMPAGTYEIRAQSPGGLPTPALTVQTVAQPLPKAWGDVTGGFSGTEWTAPNGIMNITDILAELATVQGGPTAPHPSRTDLQSVSITDSCVNRLVNAADVLMSVKAAQGDAFPFVADPALCGACP